MDQKVNRNIARSIIKNFATQFTFEIRKSTLDFLDTEDRKMIHNMEDGEYSELVFAAKDQPSDIPAIELHAAIIQMDGAVKRLEKILEKICQKD